MIVDSKGIREMLHKILHVNEVKEKKRSLGEEVEVSVVPLEVGTSNPERINIGRYGNHLRKFWILEFHVLTNFSRSLK